MNNWIKENRPSNLKEIDSRGIKEYKILKEGDDIHYGDLVHTFDDFYTEIGKGSILCKQKVNKHNTILRKK